jgi:hypothetical protein
MKLALIAIGLFAAASLASPASARGGPLHLSDPAWNPEHVRGLPAEVRNDLAHMCGNPQAEHQFARYSQNLRTLVLHFEHFRCGDRGARCTQALYLDSWPLSVVEKLLRSRGRLTASRVAV